MRKESNHKEAILNDQDVLKISQNYCAFTNFQKLIEEKKRLNVCGYSHHESYMTFSSSRELKLFVILCFDHQGLTKQLTQSKIKENFQKLLKTLTRIDIFDYQFKAIKKNYQKFQQEIKGFEKNAFIGKKNEISLIIQQHFKRIKAQNDSKQTIMRSFFVQIEGQNKNQVTLAMFISKIVKKSQVSKQTSIIDPILHLLFAIVIFYLIWEIMNKKSSQKNF